MRHFLRHPAVYIENILGSYSGFLSSQLLNLDFVFNKCLWSILVPRIWNYDPSRSKFWNKVFVDPIYDPDLVPKIRILWSNGIFRWFWLRSRFKGPKNLAKIPVWIMTNQETKAWQAIERAASSEEDLCEANLTRFFGKRWEFSEI